MGFGDYPPEYNRAVHGSYDPARYYGKPDTPLSEVRLSELWAWLGRRNKSPQAMVAAISRAHWRWMHKYVHPKYSNFTPIGQMFVVSSLFFYYLNYSKLKLHRKYKYH
ncbi:putative ATP synthase subunit f, mitochondrial [Varroa jacobsoni]|uniref:ATP synthase subunit f, mitochondrial n=1 Tax=Varroa destructor TaxID=109461 RepID=A0A7M7KI24_VARDE|nr:putative ATP synthase subunit f, mitochondrial [Varroa destructor]XP_022697923.1 putative ATP synthase subunit f, mitochondrial [Varroa jacobsoni]